MRIPVVFFLNSISRTTTSVIRSRFEESAWNLLCTATAKYLESSGLVATFFHTNGLHRMGRHFLEDLRFSLMIEETILWSEQTLQKEE